METFKDDDPALKTLGIQLQKHKELNKYTDDLVMYESGISSSTILAMRQSRYKAPRGATGTAILNFMKDYDKDLIKFKSTRIEDLLLEPIRILHVGKKTELSLKSGGIETIQDLVLSSKEEVRSVVRPCDINKLNKVLNQAGLQIGMDLNLNHFGLTGTTITVEVKGSKGQVQAAIHNLNRHIRLRMEAEHVDIKLKASNPSDKEDKGVQLSQKNKKPEKSKKYPFYLSFRLVAGEGGRDMKAENKKFRNGREIATYLENIAARLRNVRSADDFDKSDLWVLDS